MPCVTQAQVKRLASVILCNVVPSVSRIVKKSLVERALPVVVVAVLRIAPMVTCDHADAPRHMTREAVLPMPVSSIEVAVTHWGAEPVEVLTRPAAPIARRAGRVPL